MLKGKLTYVSMLVAFMAGIAGHYGVSVVEADQTVIVDFVTQAIQVVSLLTGIYGRWRATGK